MEIGNQVQVHQQVTVQEEQGQQLHTMAEISD